MSRTYNVKDSAKKKLVSWQLTDHELIRQEENKEAIAIRYQDIQKIYLSYNPARHRLYNYTAVIQIANHPSMYRLDSYSYRQPDKYTDQRKTYTPFVKELIYEASSNNPAFGVYSGRGMRRFLIELTGLLGIPILGGILLAAAFWPVSLLRGGILALGILVFCAAYSIIYFRKRYPQKVSMRDIPKQLLPAI